MNGYELAEALRALPAIRHADDRRHRLHMYEIATARSVRLQRFSDKPITRATSSTSSSGCGLNARRSPRREDRIAMPIESRKRPSSSSTTPRRAASPRRAATAGYACSRRPTPRRLARRPTPRPHSATWRCPPRRHRTVPPPAEDSRFASRPPPVSARRKDSAPRSKDQGRRGRLPRSPLDPPRLVAQSRAFRAARVEAHYRDIVESQRHHLHARLSTGG